MIVPVAPRPKKKLAEIAAGIDVGSLSAEAVLLGGGGVIAYAIISTGVDSRGAAEKALSTALQSAGLEFADLAVIVATGYGRISVPFAHKRITEISCHGRGAFYINPAARTVIDIGGQDSKVIRLDDEGRVLDFAMNDKCAAGTGRFLQVIAAALGVDVSELASLSAGKSPLTLNSMCTVFAESEVISLISQGKEKGEIIAGLHQSIARRIASMVQRMGAINRITFTGGVARNEGVRESLEQQLGVPVLVPEDCQMAGAIGAALIAQDYSRK